MTYYQTTLATIPGRDIRRPAESTEARIAHLEAWQAETAHMAFTAGYKARAAELATLKGEYK
jgi:hypothetical protein